MLTDAEYRRRRDAGEALHVKRGVVDITFSSPADLRTAAAATGWWRPGLAATRLLVDKTGDVEPLRRTLEEMPTELAEEQVREHFDAYLNSFYRSLKAWRRGDALAGRIEAAESTMHLVRTLFALERRWWPYPNRLRARLAELEPQGWHAADLEEELLALVSRGDPAVQQRLEKRVERLLRARGYGDVVDGWEGEIERVRGFVF